MTFLISFGFLFIASTCIFLSYQLKKSLPFLFISLMILVCYHLDALATISYGSLYFSNFFQTAGFSSDGILFVVTDATLVIFVLSFLNIFFGKRTIINTTHVFDVKRLVVLSTLLLMVILFYIFKKMPYQITDLLVNRQAYFSENPLVLICLHALPIIGISNVVALLETKNMLLRSFSLISLLIVIFLSVLSGSRTAFIVGIVLPILFYRFIPILNAKLTFTLLSKYIRLILIFGLIIILSAFYRDLARGDQADPGFLVSADFVALDSSVLILEQNQANHSTYLSAFTFMIPRSMWPEKPVSGNHYLTEKFFPARFSSDGQGAEITSSILGEGYINFSRAGVVSATLISFLLIISSQYLINRGGLYAFLGIIFFTRGINLVRGDLINFVVPLFVCLMLVLILTISFRYRRA